MESREEDLFLTSVGPPWRLFASAELSQEDCPGEGSNKRHKLRSIFETAVFVTVDLAIASHLEYRIIVTSLNPIFLKPLKLVTVQERGRKPRRRAGRDKKREDSQNIHEVASIFLPVLELWTETPQRLPAQNSTKLSSNYGTTV